MRVCACVCVCVCACVCVCVRLFNFVCTMCMSPQLLIFSRPRGSSLVPKKKTNINSFFHRSYVACEKSV